MSESKLNSQPLGLKPLTGWQAMMVPPILLLVAVNVYLRDRIFSMLLPRRSYEKFVFVPRDRLSLNSPNEKSTVSKTKQVI